MGGAQIHAATWRTLCAVRTGALQRALYRCAMAADMWLACHQTFANWFLVPLKMVLVTIGGFTGLLREVHAEAPPTAAIHCMEVR